MVGGGEYVRVKVNDVGQDLTFYLRLYARFAGVYSFSDGERVDFFFLGSAKLLFAEDGSLP